MNVDLFLGCYRHGEISTFPREILDQALGALAEEKYDQFWILPDSKKLYIYRDGDEICAFSIRNPPGDERFWEGLLEILRETPSALSWLCWVHRPDGGAIVGNEAMIAELPPYITETFSPVKVCSTVDEMQEFIRTHPSCRGLPRPPA